MENLYTIKWLEARQIWWRVTNKRTIYHRKDKGYGRSLLGGWKQTFPAIMVNNELFDGNHRINALMKLCPTSLVPVIETETRQQAHEIYNKIYKCQT